MAETELNVDEEALFVRAAGRATHAATTHAARHALRIAAAEGMRAIVHKAYATHAVAAGAANSVARAGVDAARVDTNLCGRAATVVVAHVRGGRKVNTDVVAAALAGGACAARGALCGTGSVQAHATCAAFVVELTHAARSATASIDTDVAAAAGVCRIAVTHAIGAEEGVVLGALPVAADETVGTLVIAHACADFGGRSLHWAETFATRAGRALRAVRFSRATDNATQGCAMTAIGTLEVAAANWTFRRRNQTAADAIARVAAGLVAVITVLGTTACTNDRRAQGKEAQTEFQHR